MKTALITGAASRIGRVIAEHFHAHGWRVFIHYQTAKTAAENLVSALNEIRKNSAFSICADLSSPANLAVFEKMKIDVLVNNAARFRATPFASASAQDWDEIVGVNLFAPYFLMQKLAPSLKSRRGAIVNIIDIHAERPLKHHTIYNTAKAGLAMLTKSLAKDLAPEVRVNGVSPGAILWPENSAELDEKSQKQIIEKIPMKRQGTPEDIARAVYFLATSDYITGQILAVDGGRNLNQ